MKPRIFIGSSVESLSIAYSVQQLLEHDSLPTVWTQGIFELSKTTLESLMNTLHNSDYAIFIFKPDDLSTIKRENYNVVRDNVIFELGLFIGKLGRENVFFVVPKDTENLHLPSDLNGVTYGSYDPNRTDQNMLAALGPFCNQVREIISQINPNISPEEQYEQIINQKENKISGLVREIESLSLQFEMSKFINDRHRRGGKNRKLVFADSHIIHEVYDKINILHFVDTLYDHFTGPYLLIKKFKEYPNPIETELKDEDLTNLGKKIVMRNSLEEPFI